MNPELKNNQGQNSQGPARTDLQDAEAFRRAARLFVGFSVATALVALALWRWFHAGASFFDGEGSTVGNLGFFLLINLNIVIVMILGFLVVKNIVKLFLDRRRNILGSKLRARLVAAFVGLSLIPTVLLFTVAKGIVERVLQGWFSPQVAASVDGALDIAKLYYEQSESQLSRQIEHLSSTFAKVLPFVTGDGLPLSERSLLSARLNNPEKNAASAERVAATEESKAALLRYLEEKRSEYGLYSLAILDQNDAVVFEAREQTSPGGMGSSVFRIPGPNTAAAATARQGSVVVRPEQSLDAEFLRAYAPLTLSENVNAGTPGGAQYTLLATQWVLPALSQALADVIDAHDDYDELRTYHRPLASSYFLTLIIVTLLVIFAAVWVGFYLARGLSIPIGLLAEGTQQVAHGNLEYRIPEVGDDELSVLVKSFNTMTQDLKNTTGELIARRRYMETVLGQVGVGVISLDTDGRVATCNSTARTILGVSRKPSGEGTTPELAGFGSRRFDQICPASIGAALNTMQQTLLQTGERFVSEPVVLSPEEGSKHLQLTLTRLTAESGEDLGSVLLLDDITELVGAQRMAAWRDVARRIAHEIKNPLTPIQLNAQRVQRKFGTQAAQGLLPVQILRESDREMINEATDMIVKQVEILRNLVNEFSRFARMPRAQLTVSEFSPLVQQAVAFFREAHPAILFTVDCDPGVPEFPFDREQMNRVLVNLLTNAVSAIEQAHSAPAQAPGSEPGVVAVHVLFDAAIDLVTLEIADNGVGIAPEDKPKLFEPYFSTKKAGTGLGLAIVNTIVADHSGYIRVRDNRPHGAKFSVELPVNREAMRKLA